MPKKYSAEFKTEVVLKTIQEDRPIKDVAEAYGVHPACDRSSRITFRITTENADAQVASN